LARRETADGITLAQVDRPATPPRRPRRWHHAIQGRPAVRQPRRRPDKPQIGERLLTSRDTVKTLLATCSPSSESRAGRAHRPDVEHQL